MTRWAVLVVALAGCDRVLGLGTINPSADAAPDVPIVDVTAIDAPPVPCSVAAFTGTPVIILVNASWYSTDESRTHAAAQGSLAGQILFGAADTSAPPLASLPAGTNELLDEPRLAPEGDELFVRVYDTGAASYTIRSYTLSAGNWSVHGTLSIGGATDVAALFHAGVPSRRGNRRMVVDVGGSFTELMESSDLHWDMLAQYNASVLLASSSMREPNLTADGLRLVFVDLDKSNLPQIDTALRLPGGGFVRDTSVPVLVQPMEVSGGQPYLSADCKHLYMTDQSTRIVRYDVP